MNRVPPPLMLRRIEPEDLLLTENEWLKYVLDWGARYVYLMRSTNGLHKIGISNDPERRVRQVSCEFPWAKPVTLVHAFLTEMPLRYEEYLHGYFAEQARGNEWFDLSPLDVEAICSIEGELPPASHLP